MAANESINFKTTGTALPASKARTAGRPRTEAELVARAVGFFALLTPEQERAVMAYRGDETLGDPLEREPVK